MFISQSSNLVKKRKVKTSFKEDIEPFESQVNDEKLSSLLMNLSWDCLDVVMCVDGIILACKSWQQNVSERPNFDKINASVMQIIDRIREANMRIEELLIIE